MFEDCAAEGHAVGEAGGDEPGEVDRGVDTDGGEGGGGGDAGGEGEGGEGAELRGGLNEGVSLGIRRWVLDLHLGRCL